MPYRSDIAYSYDGTASGLMCCIFESYLSREHPQLLIRPSDIQLPLMELREIRTDAGNANRVAKGIVDRISVEALEYVEQAVLCHHQGADLAALRFARLGFSVGPVVVDMLQQPDVALMHSALRHLWNEAHLLKGFIRFSDHNGGLTATISPKNRVLPLISDHFADRYNSEVFMIYDATHSEALVYQQGRSGIFKLEGYQPPEKCARELQIEALWKQFYHTIGIKERLNERCRVGHMPKRYWQHMIEVEGELCYNQREVKRMAGVSYERADLLPEKEPYGIEG